MVAHDGREDWARCSTWTPTLVLLDIGMPGIDGYETCRRIRAAVGGAVRVVALTGWGQEQDKREADAPASTRTSPSPPTPAALERLLAELPGAD